MTRQPNQQTTAETTKVQCNQDVSTTETETTLEPNITDGHELVTTRCGRVAKPPKCLIQETDLNDLEGRCSSMYLCIHVLMHTHMLSCNYYVICRYVIMYDVIVYQLAI